MKVFGTTTYSATLTPMVAQAEQGQARWRSTQSRLVA
jgi:hypothetical protein